MTDIVLVALITGIFGIISAFIAAYAASSKSSNEMVKAQAVFETKLDALTREVRNHNNFAQRMPAIEEQIRGLDGRIKTLERKGT